MGQGLQMNTGSVLIGKPRLGAWLSYGLGTENANLPSFVVMTNPRGGPIGSASHWTGGFMPAAYQGTRFRSQESPLLDLAAPAGVSVRMQRRSLDLLGELNREPLKKLRAERKTKRLDCDSSHLSALPNPNSSHAFFPTSWRFRCKRRQRMSAISRKRRGRGRRCTGWTTLARRTLDTTSV